MKQTYRIGKRFRKIKALSMTVNGLVVFAFYFIYRFLLMEHIPQFTGAPLAILFVLIGVVIGKGTLYFAERYENGVAYTVERDRLVVRHGESEKQYAWKDFSEAKLQEFSFRGVLPAEYTVNGQTLVLNQYLEDLCGLTQNILQHIQPYATIDPELEKRANNMRGIY